MLISNLALIVVVSIAVLNLLLGFIALVRNPSAPLNRLLFLMTISLVFWSSSSLISDDTSDFNLSRVTSSLAFSGGFLVLFFMYLFSVWFRGEKYTLKKLAVLLSLSLIVSALYATPLVYNLTTIDDYETGILYVPYLLSLLVLLFLVVKNFFYVIRRGTDDRRHQAKIVLFGVSSMTVAALITNAILPLVFEESADSITTLGPLFTVFFTGSTTYAIVKHKLFDIKSVIARAATYTLLTLFIVVAYVTVAFFIKRLVFPDLQVTGPQLLSNIILSIILVVLYPYVKKYFNKLTSSVFFRDSYDTQVFLDELNKTLVSNIQIETLLIRSSQIIEMNLKSSFCSFFIRDTSYFTSRLIGDYNSKLSDEEIHRVQELLPKIKKKIIYTEEEFQNEEEAELAKILKANDIEVLVRLVSTLDYEVAGIGYLLIGAKRSGNLYSKQDLKLLEIIANELVIAIENALRFEEIEQFNVTLQKKVDDATKELKASNDKLQALDEAKDEFISMASHQLRTPLTSVKGYLSMLLEGDAGDMNDTQKQFVSQSFTSAQRMVYLIADLLNVSRLKTGKFVIENTETHLADVVEQELAQLSETAKARNIELVYDKPADFPVLFMDETKIRQVIMNFADNAVHYTQSGGHIQIKLEIIGDTVQYTVTDDGIGVPKKEQHHLFTKFYRAGNARKARPDGTGLGLFMAKKVIVAQGGSIIFRSSEGKGSTFGFTFPLSKLQKL